jgi:hypothetical protein
MTETANQPATFDEFIALLESGELENPDRPVLCLDVTSRWTAEDLELVAIECRARALAVLSTEPAEPDLQLGRSYENMAHWLRRRAKLKRVA